MEPSGDRRVMDLLKERHCNEKGKPCYPLNMNNFRKTAAKAFPDLASDLPAILHGIEFLFMKDLCSRYPKDEEGRFQARAAVARGLQKFRPDSNDQKVEEWLKYMEDLYGNGHAHAHAHAARPLAPTQSAVTPVPVKSVPLAVWINKQYLEQGFTRLGFIGWKKFTEKLVSERPSQEAEIRELLSRLRVPGSSHELPDPFTITNSRAAERKQAQKQPSTAQNSDKQDTTNDAKALGASGSSMLLQASGSSTAACSVFQPKLSKQSQHAKDLSNAATCTSSSASFPNGTNGVVLAEISTPVIDLRRDSDPPKPFNPTSPFQASEFVGSGFSFDFSSPISKPLQTLGSSDSLSPAEFVDANPSLSDERISNDHDILAKKLKQLQVSSTTESSSQKNPSVSGAGNQTLDFQLLGKLLAGRRSNTNTSTLSDSIGQAPLLTGNVLVERAGQLLPQYGLLGSLFDGDHASPGSQVFLNTNVPFSAFICGVQGSGKSHTTSCILENTVIPSPNLGRLQSPVSTLVFSYSDWSSGGAGFNISEAAFLGAENPSYPGHHVKRVNVLISPSNPAIRKLYQRLPNVRMIPFKLKAKTLDIGALRTLMAVDEKSTIPLYMARVEAVLRGIAAESEDGSLNYAEFKHRLAQENFDPTQTNMLEMRLNLLESFLDMQGDAPEADFQPGEITIMDLSDAFVSPGTACILFKLGLERFLQCSAPGKMVVLDEAHKYMLNTPGSRVLTDYLAKVVRLQRHQGARVVSSTQESTVSTDLIALCSITVMHRFTSPTWFAALRKHIHAVEDDKAIMQRIESLETGEALVYSPNAVLGKQEDGSLAKATGRLLRLHIRDRVTLDGGASIMAV